MGGNLGKESKPPAAESKYGKGFGSDNAPKEKDKSSGAKPVAKSNLKKPVKKVDRSKIGQPTNFQHTGHIGIGEMRSGAVDPNKIKEQMMTVAATIDLGDIDDEPKKEETPKKEEETKKEEPAAESSGA